MRRMDKHLRDRKRQSGVCQARRNEGGSDYINLKEALIRLGSAQHCERIRVGAHPSI